MRLRWWAWRHDRYDGPRPHVRVFVQYFAPLADHALAHSLGLRGGMIVIANAFASAEQEGANNVVIAHELLHTFGATDKYDPATNTWRERSMMPAPRSHLAIGAVSNKIYAIGGRIGGAFISGGGNRLDLVEEYDVAADSWNPVRARMPTARSAVAYGVHGGRVYVAGGEHQTSAATCNPPAPASKCIPTRTTLTNSKALRNNRWLPRRRSRTAARFSIGT